MHPTSGNGVDELRARGVSLVQQALDGYDDTYGAGFMSCAVYDTAWVALITKTVDGHKRWLFPECFEYLLATQAADGSWGKETGSQIDGILNTAASLLALTRHRAEPLDIQDVTVDDLDVRITRAAASLNSQLSTWDVSTTTHVGFEIIVPAMLDYLKQQDPLLAFEFDGRPVLESVNAMKLARFKPEYLYGPVKLTALHSLEAFIGKIDFDRVAHHKVQGAMMSSPSSTAAFLMHTSQWDEESEAYLRQVIKSGAGRGCGGVPSAYPSMHFEYTWIMSTLFRAGFTASDLQCPELGKIKDVLIRAFQEGDGIIGFAPRLEADVDDTAKGLICLNEMGYSIGPEKMIKTFESEKRFLTYALERDPSFSANCNAVLALMHQPDPSQFSSQIVKIIQFLCDYYWDADGIISDKWNLCHLYPGLLVVEALMDVLALAEKGAVVLDQNLQSRVLVTLVQTCTRTLLTQKENGSWNDSTEETAYGVLTLSEVRKLAVLEPLHQVLDSALGGGRNFLQSESGKAYNHIWIEKVTYASPLLTDCYVLAALKASSETTGARVGTSLHDPASSKAMGKYVKLFQLTPLFAATPEWQLVASMIEAAAFQPLLRARRLDVFPRKDMEADKYFDIIPFTWTACNNRTRAFASTSYIYEMMVISFLNYQADEFMEAVAGVVFQGRTEELRQLIDRVCIEPRSEPGKNGADANGNGHSNSLHRNGNGHGGNGASHGNGHLSQADYQEVHGPLSKFVSHVSNHPAVLAASAWDRASVMRQLRIFLHAHVTQSEDNAKFVNGARDTNGVRSFANDTFFQWVRTTSADHTSCPYSFSFVSCLMSALNNGQECFPTASEKYLAEDMCRHLATMCRMYNDYGSVARDEAENNLNSINFPEYGSYTSPDSKKTALFQLAEYERSCLNVARERLGAETRSPSDAAKVKGRQMELWDMFCDVTDLYGQIYVVRDIASRMTGTGKKV